ncbi:MAG: response regulator [Crinalium sp.]
MNINESLPYKGDILVVDDTPANLTLLTQVLSEQGYKVRVAPIGKMVLRSVQSNPPALILLDIQMPGMDGYEVCKQLKSDPDARDIPVIFISALDEAIDKVKAFKVGGVDYITKPFQSVEVLARVENQLRIRSLQLQLIEQNAQLEQEIQHRTEAEEILYQSRSLLSSILNSSLDGIVAMQSVWNERGNLEDFSCLVINPVAAKIFGYKKKDLFGKMWLKSFLKVIDPHIFDLLVQVVNTGESLDHEICYRPEDEAIWYHCIAVKLGDGLAVTFRDITRLSRS